MSTPWRRVRDQLINDGTMTEQDVTRTPKPRHCRHCGRAVIAAITDLGFEVAVEPTPTTPAGELTVLLSGGETYWVADHGEMVWRDQNRIAHQNADKEQTHARHQCGKPPPETHPAFLAKKPKREYRESDPIPF